MKIGIFINYAPNVELRKEGLGRYLGGLINGFIENSNQITIACPVWGAEHIKQLMKDYDKTEEDYSIITYRRVPIVLKIRRLIKLLRIKKVKSNRVYKNNVKNVIEEQIIVFSRHESTISFILHALVLGLAGFSVMIFTFIIKLCGKIVEKVKRKIRVTGKIKRIIDIFAGIVAEDVMDKSAKKLVKLINNSKEKQDIWYVPALFWPQVNNIKNQKVIINVPDLVTEVFPVSFSDIIPPQKTKMCRKTILGGKRFITYCEYVGKELLENEFGIDHAKWKKIYHSNHDLKKYIDIQCDIQKMNKGVDYTIEFAKKVIGKLETSSILTSGRHIANSEYIFYSSQCRPNKNMYNLIKAYEYLIRKRFLHIKLVLTGDIKEIKAIKKYVEEHDLKKEVIICHGVSMQELAALYACAKLVVNPTLYEGGFPFTFGEGMSVGTPSVMSDIPQVREVFDKAELDEALFNPVDYIDIAKKIEWALDNLDYLYRKELPLYNEQALRTDEDVTKEYLQAFEEYINDDKNIQLA